jgi:hypothetical protein
LGTPVGMKTFCASVLFLAIVLLCIGARVAHADAVDDNSAASLRTKYDGLQERLSHNQFQKPLYLDSSETSDSVTGDIYARIEYPFATVRAALDNPGDWCEILILHVNTKYCRASPGSQGAVLNVSIGRKYDEPLDKAYRVDFAYRVSAQTPDYLQVRLNAEAGPFGTRDYRIVLEAVPADAGRTFIHFSYSYAYGTVGRLALQVYLATIGRNKVGFAIVGTRSDGQPLHISGIRGLVERNSMRYYLAIEAFLSAVSAPPQERIEKRLREWFAAIEHYPRQLHEMEQGEYLDMKRKEYSRQKSELQPPPGCVGHVEPTRSPPKRASYRSPRRIECGNRRVYPYPDFNASLAPRL